MYFSLDSGETIDDIGKSAVNCDAVGGLLWRLTLSCFDSERQVEARYMGYATDCRHAAVPKGDDGNGASRSCTSTETILSTVTLALATPPRTSRHRPLSRPRRPAHPALHPRQAEAGQAAGGAEAGPYPPGRDARTSTPTSASSPPAWSGWGTCRSIGNAGTWQAGCSAKMRRP